MVYPEYYVGVSQLEVGTKEFKCKKAIELIKNGVHTGWLEYSLSDGTLGMAAPGTWRKE